MGRPSKKSKMPARKIADVKKLKTTRSRAVANVNNEEDLDDEVVLNTSNVASATKRKAPASKATKGQSKRS